MRKLSLLTAVACLGGVAAAQTMTSMTLPKGWDTKEGIEVGTTTNAQFWGAFDIGPSVTTYNPARTMYTYRSEDFPWDTSQALEIKQLSFRRDGPGQSTASTAHSKKWVVILSTSDVPVANPNWNWYDGNHGPDRTVVFGSIGTPKDVTFPATNNPGTGTAPFNVVVTLDKSFTVKPNAKTLILEIRSYSVSGATSGWWRADAVQYSGTGYNGGSFSLLNTNHCISPSVFFTSRANTIGSNLGHIWRWNRDDLQNKLAVGIAGTQLMPKIVVPGTNMCEFHVNPIFIVPTVIGPSGTEGSYHDFGTVPRDTNLVGVKVTHSALTFLPAYNSIGIGLSRGAQTTIGTGYDPKLVFGSQMYSYGASSSRYVPLVEPDKEAYSRFLFRRHVIVKIN